METVSREQEAARLFALHGWPVLPGSVWHQGRFVDLASGVSLSMRPLLPRDAATTDVDLVDRWWRQNGSLVPSVMVRTGSVFDVVMVPGVLTQGVVAQRPFSEGLPGPVFRRPDGAHGFVVSPGSVLDDLYDLGVDQPVLDGAGVVVFSDLPVAMPPSRVGEAGSAQWMIAPGDVEWKPCPTRVFARAVMGALRQPVGAR